MEERYKQKIEYLQKFVPFLSKLIERLKTELDSEAKVVQLQLFYNLLICPDPSVTIEDLEKCEDALINFYKCYHTDSDDEPLLLLVGGGGEEVNKSSDVKTDKFPMNSETEQDSSDHNLKCSTKPSDSDENHKETCNSKDINEENKFEDNNKDIHEKENNKDINEKENAKSNSKDASTVENELENEAKSEEEIKITNKEQKNEENLLEKNEKEEKTDIDKKDEEVKEDEVNKESDNKQEENTNSDKKEMCEDVKAQNELENVPSQKNEGESTSATENPSDQVNTENNISETVQRNENDNENVDDKTANIDSAESDNADDDDDDELEENVELVKMPEPDSEEMILPDSEGEEEPKTAVDNEEEHESNVTETDEPEQDDDDDAAEHTEEEDSLSYEKKNNEDEETEQTEDENLLVPIQTANDFKINEGEAGDPLNVDESVINNAEDKEIADVTAAINKENNNKIDVVDDDDDDDDDVQVIETRNSPICIDSDDDVPPPTPPPPVSIKKSERKQSITTTKETRTRNFKDRPQQAGNVHLIEPKNRPPQEKYIDLIELLDSSDDDHSSTTTQKKKVKSAPKTPMKRCLLPKPIKPTESITNNQGPRQPDKFFSYAPPKPPTQVHISTPQSTFLNAVNLRPANTSNPPAFSTQLSNKNIIIPNAFYGNPPKARGIEKDKSQRQKSQQNQNTPETNSATIARTSTSRSTQINYQAWLENFMINFACPQQKASNSCFVILQRVLKYNFFQKVREARMRLDAMAQKPNPINLDIELMRALRRMFFTSDLTQLSEVGIRFCEFATNQVFGKNLALTTDIKTGRISSRTRGEICDDTTSADSKRKKQKDDDEQDEYQPSISINENELTGERKRSLRTNRVKRVDNSFSYNEDQEDTDDEEDDSYAAVKRKVEQKRQEAKNKCEQMAKSFESAFIETFAKNIAEPETTTRVIASGIYINGSEPKNQRLSANDSFRSPIVNTDLTLDDDSLDEGLQQHRIYKVLPEKLIAVSSLAPVHQQKQQRNIKAKKIEEPEIITCSDDGSDDDYDEPYPKKLLPKSTPKNTNISMHVNYKGHDKCVICKRVFQRIVHHYINEHQGCEVYTSRLTKKQVSQLRQNTGNLAEQSVYKNGQNQYEGTCAFCQRRSRFMLGYWYQHYTMHTGEYAYRCSGCNTRKPTRSLLQSHVNSSCKKRGSIRQDYKFDSKATQIDAHVCATCNYIQLQRRNVVQHVRSQHNIKTILPKHIIAVVLLKWNSAPAPAVSTITTVEDSEGAIYEIEELDSGSGSGSYMDCAGVIGSDGNFDGHANANEMYYDYYGENPAAQFNYDAGGDPSDDLSFMICGMLDVQMDTE